MPKGYCTASRQFWKTTGKPRKNSRTAHITTVQMLILTGCGENSGNWGCRPIGNKAELPSGYRQIQLLSLFSVAQRFFIFIKSRRSSSKLCKPSVVLLLFLFCSNQTTFFSPTHTRPDSPWDCRASLHFSQQCVQICLQYLLVICIKKLSALSLVEF